MKKGVIYTILILIAIVIIFQYNPLSTLIGNVTQGGIPPEEEACMKACASIGCESGDMVCMASNSNKCMSQCRAPLDNDEQCMEDCIAKTCSMDGDVAKYNSCMDQNKPQCEEECNMQGDAPDLDDMGEEQRCITECVSKVDPELRCESGKSEGAGEQGNAVCKRCADECVHLYEGTCLNDEQITEKEQACETCEHCYGELVYGDSGEGYDCIVDISCADASSEFGDDPGEGPGIIEAISNFFSNLFGGNEE